MKTILRAENRILQEIQKIFTMVGGVEPRHQDTVSIKDTFARNLAELEEAGLEISSCLRKFKGSSGKAGLDLTVSDLSLTVDLMLGTYRENAQDDSVLQSLLPPIYKGVSFNPKSFNGKRCEWLVILDFFP